MTRGRLVVLVSAVVVGVGVVAGLGAFWASPLRAAVGPLPGEALVLPADARFVMGLDVPRFAASRFFARYSQQQGMRPDALAELEEATGLDPARDLDEIVVAGTGPGTSTLALVTGRFDLYKLGRALETRGKARGYNHQGVTVYALPETHGRPMALALLDAGALLFGGQDKVEAAVSSHTRGETPLKRNATLMRLAEKVRPGSTFWIVGDQSLLASLPSTVPAPGGAEGSSLSLPSLRALTVTGDLDPQLSLAIDGEAADDAAARNLADIARGFIALASLQAQQKPELRELASAVTVATATNHVLVTARIPYALFDAMQSRPATPRPAAAPATKPAPTR